MTTSLARDTSCHKAERTCALSYRNCLRTAMMDLTLTQGSEWWTTSPSAVPRAPKSSSAEPSRPEPRTTTGTSSSHRFSTASSPASAIAQEEIFGPVLSVVTYEDEEEAVAVVNGTRHGPTATVRTQDVGRAIRLARHVRAGQSAVNTLGDGGPAGAIGVPFGGHKHSGFGHTMGPDHLKDWTQVKCVVINVA